MNALVALLHFCEVHGPCVVFCTQAIHRPDLPHHDSDTILTIPTHFKDKSTDNHPTTPSPPPPPQTLTPTQTPHLQPSASISSTLSISELHASPTTTTTTTNSSSSSSGSTTNTNTNNNPSPRLQSPPSLTSLRKVPCSITSSSSSTKGFTSSLRDHPLSGQTSTCAACTAQMPMITTKEHCGPQEARSLLTRDEEDPSVSYIGSKAPQQLHLYKAVRLACVRSLTTEFCPGRDGPVLFGDDENGYVMSYMFKLRDSQARGEVRFYSLMMLMTDRVYLISCWPFLVSAFRSMAINLQERADVIFQSEKESRERQPVFHTMANNRRVAPMSQDQFFRRRSNTSLRSLVDLLNIKDIYAQIHAQFSYILKLSSRKRMEKISPGRSAGPAYLKMRAEYLAKKNRQHEGAMKDTRP
ncbi:vesicle coat protein [Phycomyces blakesleeanus]